MGPWGWHGWGLGMWGMGMLGVLVIGAIILLIVLLVRSRDQESAAPPGATGRRAAQAILDERLARGEIDVQEYTERSHALGNR